jgi:hypothetical protein
MSDLAGFGTFSDPIVGGMSVLIRDAIRSRNYVAGVSGWSINQDGTAEFSDIVIRGAGEFGPNPGQHIELTATGEILIYDAANQLVMQLDGSGLLVQDIATGAAALLTLAAGVTILALTPPAVVGYTFGPAFVYGDSDPGLGDAWMRLESPQINGGGVARITMWGENTTNPTDPETQVRISATTVSVGGNFAIGRGSVARALSAVDSAAVTAETTVLTSTSFDYENGRAYKATCGPLVSNSNNNGRSGFRLRKNNAAGQLLGFGGLLPSSPIAGNFCNGESTFYFRNVSGANITCFIALTLQNFDGGANTSQQRVTGGLNRWLYVEDCGDADAFDWATNLV